jgi:membrane fusion protein (multidrug efflux system)
MGVVDSVGTRWVPVRRLMLPVSAVAIAVAFVWFAALRWNAWVGSASSQVTDDAYVRAHITRLSTRVSGQVHIVAVNDFQRVRAGDLLVEVDQEDYAAAVAQAEASVAAAKAAMDNLDNQVELQYATIAQAEAARQAVMAREVETKQEEERQQSLTATNSGTRQRLEQAIADHARAQADVKASAAFIAMQRHQMAVLNGTKQQRAADLLGAQAALTAAKLKLSYTRIVAPFDGLVSERQVQPGDYVNVGSSLISVVPIPNVYVMANYKETQLTRVKTGQRVDISVDTFPDQILRGRVKRIAPASGSQFALLPPDNATGNFTKVVERVPVRIKFDAGQPLVDRLLPGMSVITRIHIEEAVAAVDQPITGSTPNE